MSRSWPKNDAHPPTTVHMRERESDQGSVRNTQRHQRFKNKNLLDKAAGRIIEFSNDILKNYTKVKTDVENCRLLQQGVGEGERGREERGWEGGEGGEGRGGEWNEFVPSPIPALSTNQNMRRVSTSQEQQPGQDRVSTSACEM